mgnify:CR=1 FL=1
MPSTSGKQHRFMAAVASNPKFAKKAGVPQSVGEEFLKADKGKKFAKGGEMAESKAMMKKEIGFMKKAGAPKSMIKHEESEMKGMKKMAAGGDTTMSNPSKERKGMTMEKMGKVVAGGKRPHGEHTVQQKGHTKGTQIKMAGSSKGMKKGGKTC